MNTLPDLIPKRLLLMIVDNHTRPLVPTLIAQLALCAPLLVVDAGNCFAAYTIAREIRRATPDLYTALRRIQLARAFTCFQVLTLLEKIPAGLTPVLILDLLSTFYDENVRTAERQRLFVRCVEELQRIKRQAPIGVIVTQRLRQPETPGFLKVLENAADETWAFEPEYPMSQARLI